MPLNVQITMIHANDKLMIDLDELVLVLGGLLKMLVVEASAYEILPKGKRNIIFDIFNRIYIA